MSAPQYPVGKYGFPKEGGSTATQRQLREAGFGLIDSLKEEVPILYDEEGGIAAVWDEGRWWTPREIEQASPCKLCGGKVAAKDPERYPYCSGCHYTGAASDDLRSEQIARFRAAFPDARHIGVEHTGGGCFWLAFYFGDDERAPFYAATSGEASLPEADDVPLPSGGWGVIVRYDDIDDLEQHEVILEAQVEGAGYWSSDKASKRYWDDYPTFSFSDEALIEAIRADRAKASA